MFIHFIIVLVLIAALNIFLPGQEHRSLRWLIGISACIAFFFSGL